MTLYVETSAVLRWLFNEALSDAVLESLKTAPTVVTSRLTIIETRRSIRRALVEGRITDAASADISAAFAQAAEAAARRRNRGHARSHDFH